MKLRQTLRKGRVAIEGFSLLENLVAIAIIGVAVVAFYAAFGQGSRMAVMSREDRRATQVLLQKCEALRMCTWELLNSNGYVPTNFTATYDPQSMNSGVVFTGRISIASAPLGTPYSNDLKLVTVQLNWTTGRVPRQRQLKTFVARHGLSTYID